MFWKEKFLFKKRIFLASALVTVGAPQAFRNEVEE